MTTRKELVEALRVRYRSAAFGDRIKVLDEFVALTGYHRKHAVRLLREAVESATAASTRNRLYDEAVRQALTVLWEAADRVCGKRLRVLIPRALLVLFSDFMKFSPLWLSGTFDSRSSQDFGPCHPKETSDRRLERHARGGARKTRADGHRKGIGQGLLAPPLYGWRSVVSIAGGGVAAATSAEPSSHGPRTAHGFALTMFQSVPQ